MPHSAASTFTRHEVLVRAWRALGGFTLLALTGHPRDAAAAKVQKEDVAYQDKPKAGKSCASCRQFSPTAAGKGTCAVVEGEVSASGWCTAYSPGGVTTSRNVAVPSTASAEEGVHT
ncbi:MAG TPA: high-potential iron-sulfur protein [Burkholderiaceae bacterium]